jgi:hypothetical protein
LCFGHGVPLGGKAGFANILWKKGKITS